MQPIDPREQGVGQVGVCKYTYIHTDIHTYILHSMDPELVKNDCGMWNKL
jgi:hypothetical protein